MSEVIAALVGVVAGALLVQAGRAAVAWREVTEHDEIAVAENERLLIWVDDRTRQLVETMSGIHNAAAGHGMHTSGSNGGQLAAAKANALHEYRDERQRLLDRLRALRTQEGPWHSLWRWVRGKPAPTITVEGKAAPFLDRWREPVTRHGSYPTDVAPVFDRTKRDYEDALKELPSLKLN